MADGPFAYATRSRLHMLVLAEYAGKGGVYICDDYRRTIDSELVAAELMTADKVLTELGRGQLSLLALLQRRTQLQMRKILSDAGICISEGDYPPLTDAEEAELGELNSQLELRELKNHGLDCDES